MLGEGECNNLGKDLSEVGETDQRGLNPQLIETELNILEVSGNGSANQLALCCNCSNLVPECCDGLRLKAADVSYRMITLDGFVQLLLDLPHVLLRTSLVILPCTHLLIFQEIHQYYSHTDTTHRNRYFLTKNMMGLV